MKILLVSDIYGKHDSLEELSEKLQRQDAEVSLLTPYADSIDYSLAEEEVYALFVEQCGHAKYSQRVLQYLRGETVDVILSFSAGGSAAWLAAAQQETSSLSHLICFYPTRIRHHVEAVPLCPATIIFPSHEDVFDVTEMVKLFDGKEGVRALPTPFEHGFMNPCSRGYSNDAQTFFTEVLSIPEVLGCQNRFVEKVSGKLAQL